MARHRVAYVPGNVAQTLTPHVNQTARYIDRHACAWGDPDRDGMPDIACAAGRYSSDRVKDQYIDDELFLQGTGAAAGTFTDVAVAAGVNEPCQYGRFTTFLDANGDDSDDLFVGVQKERSIASDPCNSAAMGYPNNERSKIFINRGAAANGTWLGYRFEAAWNTIGGAFDGRLPGQLRRPAPRSPGTSTTTDETTSLTCTFPDREPYLYRNDGTRFTEVSRTAGVALARLNSVAVADISGDGLNDFLFSNNTGFFYRLGTATGLSSTTVRLGAALPNGVMGWNMTR